MATVWVLTDYGLLPFTPKIRPWGPEREHHLTFVGRWVTAWGSEPSPGLSVHVKRLTRDTRPVSGETLGQYVLQHPELGDYLRTYTPGVVGPIYRGLDATSAFMYLSIYTEAHENQWHHVCRRQLHLNFIQDIHDIIKCTLDINRPWTGPVMLVAHHMGTTVMVSDRQALNDLVAFVIEHRTLPCFGYFDGLHILSPRPSVWPYPIRDEMFELSTIVPAYVSPLLEPDDTVAPTADAPAEPPVEDSNE